jgi:hypothetical protein
MKKIRIGGTAGTAINITAYLTKHASADSGGTAATGTALPVPYALDSNYAAPTATTQSWTANPTINDSAPGYVAGQTVFLPATGTAAGPAQYYFSFNEGGLAVAPPVLRGTVQQLCVNLNGVTAPSSGVMSVEFIWTESAQ